MYKLKVQIVYKTPLNVQILNNKITNSSFMTNNKCAENEHKLKTELVNNLSQLKSHSQQKIKGKD